MFDYVISIGAEQIMCVEGLMSIYKKGEELFVFYKSKFGWNYYRMNKEQLVQFFSIGISIIMATTVSNHKLTTHDFTHLGKYIFN